MLISDYIINYNKDITKRLIDYIDCEIDNHHNIIKHMSDDDKDQYIDDFLSHTAKYTTVKSVRPLDFL